MRQTLLLPLDGSELGEAAVPWAACLARADLIVMTTHGRTGPARWLLGSVADEVVRRAEHPFFVITARINAPRPKISGRRPANLGAGQDRIRH
jgi:hypothetical protein